MLGFYNPSPASVVGTVWLDPRSRSAAASVDLHSQERQTPLPTSYSVSQPRLAEASVANALRVTTLQAVTWAGAARRIPRRRNSAEGRCTPSRRTGTGVQRPEALTTSKKVLSGP